jgi:hypothetical protein
MCGELRPRKDGREVDDPGRSICGSTAALPALAAVIPDVRVPAGRVLANDRVRIGYVRASYGVDPEDPDLYRLWIDSTALDVDTCVELIVTAARARVRHPAAAVDA